MMDVASKSPYMRQGLVVGVCVLFMAVGPALMVLNKEILDSVGFRYPLLVSCLGLAFAAIVTHALHFFGYLDLKHRQVVDFKFWYTRCLPVGICHAATLSFGNAQYLYTGMAMIQFLKSFTPIVTALFSFFIQGKVESGSQSFALILICFGTSLAASGDMNLTLHSNEGTEIESGGRLWEETKQFGLLLAVGSSCTEAIRLVLTDLLLSGHKMEVLESTYYLAPGGAACLFLTGCVVEGPALLAKGDLIKLTQYPATFFFAASLGLGVQLLTTSVIKMTSATSLKVLSQVRNAIPVLYGAVVYEEYIGAQSAMGYVISVMAFAWYTYLKMQQARPSLPSSDSQTALRDLELGAGAGSSGGGGTPLIPSGDSTNAAQDKGK